MDKFNKMLAGGEPMVLSIFRIITGEEGTVITGAVVSCTVMVKLPVPVLFAASLAITVTVVTPMGKTVPLSCEYVREATPTASLAVAAS